MGECEFIGGCPFFNGDNDTTLKEKYCKNNNLHCARYMVANALGKDYMPKDLGPDQKEIAYLTIAENS